LGLVREAVNLLPSEEERSENCAARPDESGWLGGGSTEKKLIIRMGRLTSTSDDRGPALAVAQIVY
jgi:hypothetical protein